MKTNVLYCGDNLDILRRYIPDESVDAKLSTYQQAQRVDLPIAAERRDLFGGDAR